MPCSSHMRIAASIPVQPSLLPNAALSPLGVSRQPSSVMLTSGRYKGSPMQAHLKHREAIRPEMFARWLTLWGETARELLPAALAEAVVAKAERIAESLGLALWFRMPPPVAPSTAPEGVPVHG